MFKLSGTIECEDEMENGKTIEELVASGEWVEYLVDNSTGEKFTKDSPQYNDLFEKWIAGHAKNLNMVAHEKDLNYTSLV